MPGLDGLETLQRIKERTPDACVLMVTAFASIELAVDAMRLGRDRLPAQADDARDAARRGRGRDCQRVSRRPKRRAPRPSRTGGHRRPDAERVSDSPCRARRTASSPEHAFRVRHVADGAEFTVTVAIDPEAVERVARLTHRRLEPGGAFWRLQAERLLSAYVWSEGKRPADGRLMVRDVSARISTSPHGGSRTSAVSTLNRDQL